MPRRPHDSCGRSGFEVPSRAAGSFIRHLLFQNALDKMVDLWLHKTCLGLDAW